MHTILADSGNNKTSNPHRLLLNLSEKINLKRSIYVALSNLSIYYAWKNIKKNLSKSGTLLAPNMRNTKG